MNRELGAKCDLMSLTPADLSAILVALEPVTFSKNNQKPLLKRGCKFPQKSCALELIEYITEKEPMTSFGRGKRVADIRDPLVSLNELGGRRGRDLQLPVQWDTAGFFIKRVVGTDIFIVNRESGQRIKLCTTEINMDDIEIISNYSIVRATVAIVNEGSQKIIDMFLEDGAQLPCLRTPGSTGKRPGGAFSTPPAKRPIMSPTSTTTATDDGVMVPFARSLSSPEASASKQNEDEQPQSGMPTVTDAEGKPTTDSPAEEPEPAVEAEGEGDLEDEEANFQPRVT